MPGESHHKGALVLDCSIWAPLVTQPIIPHLTKEPQKQTVHKGGEEEEEDSQHRRDSFVKVAFLVSFPLQS